MVVIKQIVIGLTVCCALPLVVLLLAITGDRSRANDDQGLCGEPTAWPSGAPSPISIIARPAVGKAPATAPEHATTSPNQVQLAGVRWRDFHGIQLPYSRKNGPSSTSGGLARGFPDGAGGAVFAAVHIAVRANAQWGPEIFEPTIRDQVDGPDKTALLERLDSAYEQLADKAGTASGRPVGRAYAVEEGFRAESFSPEAATVDIVTAGPGQDGTTVRAATRIQLVWRSGDWRVLAPPGGDWGSSAHVIGSLDGYRSFGDQQPHDGRGGA